MNNYYKELPAGYKEVYSIDAKDRKTVIILNVAATVLMFASIGVLFWIKSKTTTDYIDSIFLDYAWMSFRIVLYMGAWILAYFAYLVLHEITHGIFYKACTKAKLTFGTNGLIAWCGLKEGYFNKKTGLYSILAPLVLHSLWMIPLIFITGGLISALVILLFAGHFGGCIGDMYGTYIMLKMPKDVLINDTGAKQTFYLKDKNN